MCTPLPTKRREKNICPHCGIDEDVARSMFPQGYNTCEEVWMDKGHKVEDCPMKYKYCPPSCFYWKLGKCRYMQAHQNHKGKWCWVLASRFCQENYCTGCNIFEEATAIAE